MDVEWIIVVCIVKWLILQQFVGVQVDGMDVVIGWLFVQQVGEWQVLVCVDVDSVWCVDLWVVGFFVFFFVGVYLFMGYLVFVVCFCMWYQLVVVGYIVVVGYDYVVLCVDGYVVLV